MPYILILYETNSIILIDIPDSYSAVQYKEASVQTACCTPSNSIHQNCRCSYTSDVSECKDRCDVDEACKGYVDTGDWHCDLATNSDECPYDCRMENVGNFGDLDEFAECASNVAIEYLGCFIKQFSREYSILINS